MTSQNMHDVTTTEEQHLLLEFEEKEQSRKLVGIVLLFSVVFIIIVALDFVVDLAHLDFNIKPVDWSTFFIILTFPVTGTIFYFLKKKIGWFVCLFYYIVIGVTLLSLFVEGFYKRGFSSFNVADNVEGLAILTLSLLTPALLVTKQVRRYYKIRDRVFIMVLKGALCAAVLLIVLLNSNF